ncbi:MAG: hypothetical protein M1812_002485 [Candelaria pacifica]|nr:MAG: hypothetical protein M1812_002485 [Candelaria pacifica]
MTSHADDSSTKLLKPVPANTPAPPIVEGTMARLWHMIANPLSWIPVLIFPRLIRWIFALYDFLRGGCAPVSSPMSLSPFDQMTVRFYTRGLMYFPLQPGSDHATIIYILREGLREVVTQIPFLAWNVTPATDGFIQEGRLEVAKGDRGNDILTIKDLTSSPEDRKAWDYETIRKGNFPASDKYFELFTIDRIPQQGKPVPVMTAQVNLLTGGFILSLSFHHSVADGSGDAMILAMWAQSCSRVSANYRSTLEAIAAYINPISAINYRMFLPGPTSFDRDAVSARYHRSSIAEHPEWENTPEWIAHNAAPPASDTPSTSKESTPPIETCVFYFPFESLASLKALGSRPLVPEVFMSTDDVLSAFLWRHIIKARVSPHLYIPFSETSSLRMPVDGRTRMNPPLPKTYLGNAVLVASASMPLRSLLSDSNDAESFAQIALCIRNARKTINHEYIESILTLISSLSDISKLTAGRNVLSSTSVIITTWAKFPLHQLSWGHMIGTCERVRFPNADILQDARAIILPALADGGLEVAVGLEGEAMARLKADKEFMGFAQLKC